MASVRTVIVLLAALSFFAGFASPSPAQTSDRSGQSTAWAAPAIADAQRMRMFPDPSRSVQQAPPVIPELETDRDPSGLISTSTRRRHTDLA